MFKMNCQVKTFFTCFIIINSLFIAATYENAIDTQPFNISSSDFPTRKWISQLFDEAKKTFQMDSLTNSNCRMDYISYLSHLRNQSIWAVKMMESSEWPSVGLFSGRTTHLGDYDECLSISSHGIKGQYCLPEITYDYAHDPAHNKNAVENPPQDVSVWEAITMYRSNFVRTDRQKLIFALCIPSSCQSDELVTSLNKTLSPIFKNQGFNVSVYVNPVSCRVKADQYSDSLGFYIVSCIFLVIFLLLISSTCSDMIHGETVEKMENEEISLLLFIFRSFSMVRNFRILREHPEKDYAPIHFVKVFSMLIVIYGHRFLYFTGSPKFNSELVEQTWKWPNINIIHEDIVSVFFMISGFLTFHCNLSSMMKGGRVFFFVNFLSRWMRIMLVIAVFILYTIYILPHMSEGPLWHEKVYNEVNKCKETWWILLLSMSNWIKSDRMCLIFTWYISVDMQLALFGGILLLVFCNNKKLGLFAAIFTFIVSTIMTFLVVYINRVHGILRFSPTLSPESYANNEEFSKFYIVTYTKAGPYLVGFLGAFVTKFRKDRKYVFSKKQSCILWLVGILLCEGTLHYSFLFYKFGREYSRVENAIYGSIHQSLFVLGFATFLCVYLTSEGIFDKFFNWKGFVPIGRLTYSVYLTNMMVQFYHTYLQRQVSTAHLNTNQFWLTFGDFVWIYMVGLLVYLFIEAPIANISKLVRKKLMKTFEYQWNLSNMLRK